MQVDVIVYTYDCISLIERTRVNPIFVRFVER